MDVVFVGLLVLESALTVVGILLFVYRGMLEFKEENTLVLGNAEAHLVADQQAIHRKATQLGSALKFVTIAWVVFGIALFAAWIITGLNLM